MYRSNIRCKALCPSTTLRIGLLHPTNKSHHLQLLQQHPQRLAAMADGVFLFALKLRAALAQFRQPEQRVIAETAVTTGLHGDLAVPLAFCDCLLYTSDAADDLLCVDLGGRRII